MVSVIIPTYKRPLTLERAINSCLNQTYKNIEVIVIDDNNDGDEYREETEKLMEKYAEDNKVIYIKHEKNMNGSAARNTGIKKSKGKYIAFLDDDDEFLPDKIKRQVERMESLDGTWGACYTGYRKEKNGVILEKGTEKREGNLKKQALMRTLYISGGSNLLVRRNVVEEINGFDESFKRNQDLEFLVRILDKYKLAYVNSCSLIIHFDSRVANITPEYMKEIDELYLQSFKSEIEGMSIEDQNDFYTMKELDMFKLLLQKKRLIEAIKHIFDKKINIFLLFKYIVYLIKRAITKECYGFKFN